MKAVVYCAPKELELQDVAEPVATRDDEVVLDVIAAGICGSEVEGVASGSPFRRPPLIMGHEFVGRDPGSGTAVVVNPLLVCRRCRACLRGRPNICERRELIGVNRAGGFAEKALVPVSNCYPLPSGLDPVLGVAAEPLANAVHAVRRAISALGRVPERVGVVGAGMLGTMTALVFKCHGVETVSVAELSADRWGPAVAVGASPVTKALSGKFEVVVDAVGTRATRTMAADGLVRGGLAIYLGLHDPDPGFDAQALVRNEQSVLGSFCYTDDDFIAATLLLPRILPEWISVRPITDGVAAFDRLMNHETASLKIALVP